MVNKNTRGSEWQKWDLHIHTPNTGKNDQFEGKNNEEKWEKYLSLIEKNNDIKVLGVTDYFSMDNYYYMKEQQKKGRIPDVYLIPNVELRILPVTDKNNPINIHVLFDPNLNKETINRNFFYTLEFNYGGSRYQCNRDSITQLGKAIKGDNGSYHDGLEQFNITFDNLRESLKSEALKGHYLVGLSNGSKDGNSGIQENSLTATRMEIYKLSDFIFSSNPNDVVFFLGKGNKSPDDVKKQYGSLKPCITGCDAHKNSDMFEFAKNRYTWIKALPTFEGLKQIIFEPEERVCISEEKPEEKSDYQIIDSIQFTNAEMKSQEIKFNQGLNTIIGGRSSGKSILLGCLATTIDSSFTAKNKDLCKDYNDYITNLVKEGVSVKWRDNKPDRRKIIYFFQSRISDIVQGNKDDRTEITDLIERIVKENIEKQNLISTHESFLLANRTAINNSINLFCEYNRMIEVKTKEINDIGNIAGIEAEITKLEFEINNIKSTLPDYLSAEEDLKYSELKNRIKNNNSRIDELTSDENQLPTLKASSIFSSIDHILSKISKSNYGEIKKYFEEMKEKTMLEWYQYIDEKMYEIKNTIIGLTNDIDVAKKDAIFIRGETLQENNSAIKTKREKLESEINRKNIIKQLEEERKKLIEARDNYSKDIWDKFEEYRKKTEDLLSHLYTKKDNIEIKAGLLFKSKDFYSKALNSLNKRNTEVKKYEDFEEFSDSELKDSIKTIFDGIITGKYQTTNKYTVQQVLIDLFSTNYYQITYDIKYDGDDFNRMSEGKKAFIVLRLLLDFDDSKCPIIIDQPEDDLDNRAIYDQLVTFLRKQKKNRQIILATHNPNVVVGADAELVIVANQNGDNTKNQEDVKFEYYANAIEDSFVDNNCKTTLLSKGIREHICEILEGGDKAFEIREKKYGYKNR